VHEYQRPGLPQRADRQLDEHGDGLDQRLRARAGVGAAQSNGTIAQDANCQTAVGSARAANVTSPGGGAVAQAATSSSTSKSCRGAAPVVTNTSQVIGLGGTQVPLPAAGCANGTPDTVTGIPGVLPIVCNADDIAGAAGVREALDVFVLQVGGTSLAKETTAAAESFSVAPAAETTKPQCSDGLDNDGDGDVDADDPGCRAGGTLSGAYNPNDNDESNDRTGGSGSGRPECSDNRDNDGDGRTDRDDPGCHENNDINQPFNPDDDSEDNDDGDDGGGDDGGGNGGGNAPTGGQSADGDTLPFTGTDVIGLSLAGLLMLAGGLLLRRREGPHPA